MRRVRSSVIVALLLLGLFEVVLHATGERLGRTQEWYVAGVESVVQAMDDIRTAGIESDLVFAGTSLVMLGLRTEVAESDLASVDVAHNVGLPDAHTPIQRRWLLEQAIPRLQPDRLVWGVASLDFNGGRPQPIIDLYEEARAGKVGITGPLDRVLAEVSALSRYREFLRGPLFVKNLFNDSPPPPAFLPVESLMKSVTPWPVLEKTPERFAALRSSLVADFYIGDREGKDFEFTLDALLERGIEVVVTLMPVPSEYIEAHNDGLESFDSWREWVTAAASTRGIPVYDYSNAIPDEEFADYNHVNEQAADTLTRMLVADLQELGW